MTYAERLGEMRRKLELLSSELLSLRDEGETDAGRTCAYEFVEAAGDAVDRARQLLGQALTTL